MTGLSETDLVVRNPGLLTTEVDGEVIAMSVENGACYGLNAVGSRVWALIEEPRSIDSLCAQLLDEFEVAPDVCKREVVDLVAALRVENMVRIETAG
jgi:hypothetical protein